jgi:hypothetical protein
VLRTVPTLGLLAPVIAVLAVIALAVERYWRAAAA